MELDSLAKSGAAMLAALLLFPGAAWAHPHVWVNVETEILTGPGQEITGFRHKWTFDEMYTEFAVKGLDTNSDGIYSKEELQPLSQVNVEALKEFEYFTFVFLGKDKLSLKEPPPEHHLEYHNKLLTLYFTVPLANPVPQARFKDFNFAIYDPGIYIALTMDRKAPVKFASAANPPCDARIGSRPSPKDATAANLGENIDPASNPGLQFAERITIDCK